MQSTSVLTEHLEYPPVSLVDDIINAVNEIMYRCTAAMEKYLMKKKIINGRDYTEEIKIGMAKLETLLEHAVDRNFDKLELYALRNVLRIPQELLDAHVFRLPHQRDLIVTTEKNEQKSEFELHDLMLKIEDEFKRNRELKLQITKTKRLQNQVRSFKILVLQLLKCEDSQKSQEIFKSLEPLDDTMKFLTSQLRQLYIASEENCSREKVNETLRLAVANGLTNTRPNSRSDYIENGTQVILERLNLRDHQDDSKSSQDSSANAIPNELIIEDPQLSLLS